jgi:lipid-A-disaccharide synthase
MSTVMISCGEASGDLYAGALARELAAREPGVRLIGFGGAHLEAAGAMLAGDYHQFSVTGLTEAIRVLPRSYGMLRRLGALAREQRPDVFVAIDFPDFNFRLAAAVHAQGIPVVYYVSPQLWAWRPGRIRAMQRFVTRVLVIFPFEQEIYDRAGIPAEFVGHPLVDLLAPTSPRELFLGSLGLAPDAPTVALLPGSRRNELLGTGGILADAAKLVAARVGDVQFVVARAPKLADSLFAPFTGAGLRIALVEGRTDDVLHAADAVVTASGTATVQTALHERPMVIVYRLSPLTYKLGRPFVHVDTFGMANLVAGRTVVPELIQDDFTPERVAHETLRYLLEPEYAAATRRELAAVRARLGEPGASGRAADVVLRVARQQKHRV